MQKSQNNIKQYTFVIRDILALVIGSQARALPFSNHQDLGMPKPWC